MADSSLIISVYLALACLVVEALFLIKRSKTTALQLEQPWPHIWSNIIQYTRKYTCMMSEDK